jgi:hypothetical protein
LVTAAVDPCTRGLGERAHVPTRHPACCDDLLTKISQLLKGPDVIEKERLPHWLAAHTPGCRPSLDDFLHSRVVFYPGSGVDGSPVRFFGSRHLAHCYVYADYALGRVRLQRALEDPGFRGYRSLDRAEVSARDVGAEDVRYHITREEFRSLGDLAVGRVSPRDAPFGFIEVLERVEGFGDAHGPARLAILFLFADGHATYDGLFCQQRETPPYAVVIQDHGWGGDYSSFGAGGLMHGIATRTGRYPRYLWCADGCSIPWPGYQPVPGVPVERGGMHAMPRTIYECTTLVN